MYFICWVTGGHFTSYNLPLCDSCWSIYSGGGCRADDFKADSPFIRERRWPRFRDPLPNLFQESSDRIGIAIRALLLNCSFNEHSQYYALKRTRTSTLFSTRFWVSRVYHFTTKASWKWIIFHEYDIYLVWCMEYMIKVECWSISIDRSCHLGPNWTSNCFDLNYPENALYRYPIYQI